MKKKIYVTGSIILGIIGIISAFFLYDLLPNEFKVGLNSQRFLIHLSILFIISLHIIWLTYSKIVSSILKKDFSNVLKRDILTYLPFILLVLFPLRYLVRNLDSRFTQFMHIPSTVILIFAFGLFIFLKTLFLGIKLKKEKSLRTIVIICILIFFLIFSTLSILRHKAFFSAGADLGIYEQAMYGYANQKMLKSLFGIQLLGDHLEWILFIILPIYMVFQTPITLLIIQATLLSVGAYILYILSRKVLKSEFAALIICITYLLHPAIHYAVLFDFHPNVLPIPLFFLAVYALIRKRYLLLTILLFIISICKEYFALLFIPFGIFLIFIDIEKSKKFTALKKISRSTLLSKQSLIGVAFLLTGIAWFVINLSVLIPLFSEGPWFYVEYNNYFGNSTAEIIKTFIFHPIYSLKYILTLNRLAFVILFLTPLFFGLFALFAPEYLLLGITELAIILLHNNNSLSEIVYHHQVPLVALTLSATVIGISRISRLKKLRRRNIIAACSIALLSTTLLTNIFFGPFTILYDLDNFNINKPYVKAGYEILSMIPQNASVIAPNWVSPHLARRKEIYRLRTFLNPEFNIPNADYIIMDLSDALTDPKRSARSFEGDQLTRLFNKKEYGIIMVKNTWLLLRKGENYAENICKIKPFLNKEKYPYLNISIKNNELLEKC